MNWSSLKKLVWNPDGRWAYDPLFVIPAILIGLRVDRAYDNFLLGLAAMLPVMALREVLYHYLVRRRRPPAAPPGPQL